MSVYATNCFGFLVPFLVVPPAALQPLLRSPRTPCVWVINVSAQIFALLDKHAGRKNMILLGSRFKSNPWELKLGGHKLAPTQWRRQLASAPVLLFVWMMLLSG